MLFRSEAGCEGAHIRRMRLIEAAIEKSMGKHLTLNVTGAIGAVLTEIGFPVEGMRGVAVVSRAAGLIGHVYEEMNNPIAPSVVDFINSIEYRDPD